ncbi:hypothetical protein MRX96_041815 [Rhipicephalus microplus]
MLGARENAKDTITRRPSNLGGQERHVSLCDNQDRLPAAEMAPSLAAETRSRSSISIWPGAQEKDVRAT